MFENNSLIKIICFLFSVIGLILHSTQLFSEYMSAKTVVNMEVRRIYDDTLPGITICFPFAMSMKRTAKLNNRTIQYYQQYDGLIKELDKNFTEENLENIMIENSMIVKLHDLQNKTKDALENWQGSMLDYFDNYTVDHNQIKMIDDSKIHEGKWTDGYKSYLINPIESYA